MVLLGDCSIELLKFSDNHFDALVTDPPGGINFMNKDWDKNKGGREQWITWMSSAMRECLRVLKPGAHGLVWAIPRTSHWTGTALEQAGFEVRDVVTHLFGTGFPKSLDISKAIDKAAGVEREVIGRKTGGAHDAKSGNKGMGQGKYANSAREDSCSTADVTENMSLITAPATPEAKQWEGWGTALKPACEFWFLVRKPLSEATVAKNVLKWGTGGINIDGSRIEGPPRTTHKDGNKITNSQGMFAMGESGFIPPTATGRFPANLVLDEEAAKLLDEQSGVLLGAGNKIGTPKKSGSHFTENQTQTNFKYDNGGGASRFFYVAKASAADKNNGLEELPKRECTAKLQNSKGRSENGIITNIRPTEPKAANFHPTVKSTKLMEYLIKLITPPNGEILDPFMGSGSTGVAALKSGFKFTGIESELEYFDIAQLRIKHALGALNGDRSI